MNAEYRIKLLATMTHIEQLMAETEELKLETRDDETAERLLKLLAEHRSMLADLEEKLRAGNS